MVIVAVVEIQPGPEANARLFECQSKDAALRTRDQLFDTKKNFGTILKVNNCTCFGFYFETINQGEQQNQEAQSLVYALFGRREQLFGPLVFFFTGRLRFFAQGWVGRCSIIKNPTIPDAPGTLSQEKDTTILILTGVYQTSKLFECTHQECEAAISLAGYTPVISNDTKWTCYETKFETGNRLNVPALLFLSTLTSAPAVLSGTIFFALEKKFHDQVFAWFKAYGSSELLPRIDESAEKRHCP